MGMKHGKKGVMRRRASFSCLVCLNIQSQRQVSTLFTQVANAVKGSMLDAGADAECLLEDQCPEHLAARSYQYLTAKIQHKTTELSYLRGSKSSFSTQQTPS
jgi:hypothetical protein